MFLLVFHMHMYIFYICSYCSFIYVEMGPYYALRLALSSQSQVISLLEPSE